MSPRALCAVIGGRTLTRLRLDWIPEYLQTATKELLRLEMRTKRSPADVNGYIYAFEIEGEPRLVCGPTWSHQT